MIPRWRGRVEGAAVSTAIALGLGAWLLFGPQTALERPETRVAAKADTTPMQERLAASRASVGIWAARAETCAALLSAETGAGYDVSGGGIEQAAARATAWAEHTSELEDVFGD